MRSLLLFLVGILCTAVAPAQARQVKLELEDGKVVEGLVVEIDSRAIRVDVDGVQTTYQTDQIRKAQFTEVDGPAPKVSGEPAAPVAVQPAAPQPASPPTAQSAPVASAPAAAPEHPAPAAESAAPPASASPPADAPQQPAAGAGDPAAAASTPTVHRRRGFTPLWRDRTEALDRRYPWLFPAEPLQWISLGVMLFALLSLAVHYASRMAAAEQPGFGRACGLGAWLLLSSMAQVAFVPGTREGIAGAIGGSAVVMIVLFGVTYRLSFGASILALLLLTIEGAVGYGVLQLVDSTLRSIGNTTF
ncbi:MAG: hypothetical protein AB7O97_17935 [Planctomycetota bacterium]